MKKLIVIDSYSLIYKAFYAIRDMRTSTQIPTNAIHGFTNMLIKLLKEESPAYLYAAFDPKGETFRHKADENYKATRQKMPDELRQQIPYIKRILEALGIVIVEEQGYEADDVLGTFSKIALEQDVSCILVSGDKDSFQLANENTIIFYAKRGVSDVVVVDEAYIQKEYQLRPCQLIDVKALMGDKSDNIAGIAGIGEKTARALVEEYGSLDKIYQRIDEVSSVRIKEKLLAGKEIAYQSRYLAEICKEVPLSEPLQPYGGIADEEVLLSVLEELEMKNTIARLGLKKETEEVATLGQEELDYVRLDEKNFVRAENEAQNSKRIYVYYETDATEIGLIAFACKKETYIVESSDLPLLQKTVRMLAENGKKLVLHDVKNFIFAVRQSAVLEQVSFDVYLAAYVLDATDASYNLGALSRQYLGEEIEAVKGGGQISFLQNEEEQMQKICRCVRAIAKLAELFEKRLQEIEADALYNEIELPLANVLAQMQAEGITIDMKQLQEAGDELDEQIAQLEKEIRILGDKDESFNVNSPKQLSVLLFEELGLPVKKKTKTGYSTDIEVLESLLHQHPIIEKIIELRKAAKLNSTYIKGLLPLIDRETSKIHTTFNQTITTTGRISSSEPNLQNIPIRSQEGRLLRKAFAAKDENHLLIDADYSQIELRVLADIANDESFITSFLNDEDIHARTASEVFHVPLDMVTSTMRSKAKAVNFGIIYGISDFGLAKNLHISRVEAKQYIDTYLSYHEGVREYMKSIVEFARQNGYVETKFKRRRMIAKINDRNFNERSFAERTALNTPIQGTAADIIKIAMNGVYDELKKRKLKSKLILQVHDELIVEAPLEEKKIVTELLKEKMQNAAKLKAPLKVDICAGHTWYDCK